MVGQHGLLALVGLLVGGGNCARLSLRGGNGLVGQHGLLALVGLLVGGGKCAWLGLRGGDGLGRSKWIVGINRIASGWGEICMAWFERGRWAWSVKVDCWH